MALKIRLQRGGKTHSPRYRMVVAESRSPRDGKFIEILGKYNPQARKNEKELDLDMERIEHWLKVGALPSDTVRTMINRVRRSGGEEAAAEQPETAASEPTPEPAAVVEETPAKGAPVKAESTPMEDPEAPKAESTPAAVEEETPLKGAPVEAKSTPLEDQKPESEEASSEKEDSEDETKKEG